MAIILGLGAALAFGAADFIARFASRQIGNFRTLLYMQLIGLAGLSLWLGLVERPQKWDWPLLGLAALLGVGNTIAGLALYRAFEVGILSVVSPVAASYGAVSLVLGLLSGQKPSVTQLIGLVVTIIGVALASAPLTGLRQTAQTQPGRRGFSFNGSGISMALLASLIFGVIFWGLGFVSNGLGGVVPIWEFRLVGPLFVALVSRPLGQSIKLPQGRVWLLVAGVGLLDTAAYLFVNYGVRLADSGLVSVLTSLFSAFIILLARIFLNEKLAANQWLGVALILLGVGLVSAG